MLENREFTVPGMTQDGLKLEWIIDGNRSVFFSSNIKYITITVTTINLTTAAPPNNIYMK
jgi:hypothetical protein